MTRRAGVYSTSKSNMGATRASWVLLGEHQSIFWDRFFWYLVACNPGNSSEISKMQELGFISFTYVQLDRKLVRQMKFSIPAKLHHKGDILLKMIQKWRNIWNCSRNKASKFAQTFDFLNSTPALRVLQAETRLTVYRLFEVLSSGRSSFRLPQWRLRRWRGLWIS